jgi:hypothetical protein
MAVEKYILKNTLQESVVKVVGKSGSAAISLNSDLIADKQFISGDTQTVNIVCVNWSGLPNSTITIKRNNKLILPISADQAEVMDLSGEGYVDSVENTSDIVVEMGSVDAAVYLTLRKVSGYTSSVENAQFGAHDNPDLVGS